MLRPYLAQLITSQRLRRGFEVIRDSRSTLFHRDRILEVFLGVDDPHSYLLICVFARQSEFANLPARIHLVRGPNANYNPDPRLRDAWIRNDVSLIAPYYGVKFPQSPPASNVELKETYARLLVCLSMGRANWPEIAAAGQAYWFADHAKLESMGRQHGIADARSMENALCNGTKRLRDLGHYQPGMIYCHGSWYWGVDRLWHLRKRICSDEVESHWPRRLSATPRADQPEIQLFFSGRSPYSYIALQRLMQWHREAKIVLRLRPVLPMLMRGLQVPARKRWYIIGDAAREAARYGIPFGRIADPLGRPIERGYAILNYARSRGRVLEYMDRFMRAVWSEGVDAGSDKGLRLIVEESGLDWIRARQELGNPDWRGWADANRREMYKLGLWGVPSLYDGHTAAWGQDRLFLFN